MRKLVIAMASAVAVVLTMISPAVADDAEIVSPSADQIVYENTLELAAVDMTAVDNTVRWAVRDGTCQASAGTVAGNVDGVADPSTWMYGEFAATLDISEWTAGLYCFVFNTELGDAPGHRLSQWFYVVDDYAIVGGTLYHEGETAQGNSPTHALDGIVGDAGADGIVGHVTVNYRLLGETVTYLPVAMDLQHAFGVTGDYDIAKAVITTDGGQVQILDRDATSTYPRGAVIVRPSPDDLDYRIGGLSGADSWVGLDRGNAHVGTR